MCSFPPPELFVWQVLYTSQQASHIASQPASKLTLSDSHTFAAFAHRVSAGALFLLVAAVVPPRGVLAVEPISNLAQPGSATYIGTSDQSIWGGDYGRNYGQVFKTPDAVNTVLLSYTNFLGWRTTTGTQDFQYTVQVYEWDAAAKMPTGTALYASDLLQAFDLPIAIGFGWGYLYTAIPTTFNPPLQLDPTK